MNILFFIKPKAELTFVYDDETLRQVLEKMEYHKYAAVPMISRENGTTWGPSPKAISCGRSRNMQT